MTDTLAAALGHGYRVERELGQGGMATVYLAHDLKHDRRVAVKVISWTPRAPIFSTGTWPAIRHPGRSRTGGVGGACSIGATGC